ncbi:MAG TPA: sigma-70 family RNA polymerase sigma factor [Candidatus Limnocylindria bacterium]|nr:sigma-70 family RNA polymerase sigma factor [Candidatus Limnocylindria bacterium]
MGEPDSDDELVARVAGADHDACRRLVDRHLARVVAFAARVLGDADEAEEVRRLVTRAIDTLPERQRTALALCHYQGLGNAEAAAVMEISVEAVESLLARARRTLRERLRPLVAEAERR